MQNDEDYADELEQLLYCLFDSLWCYLINIYEFIPEKMQNDEDYAEEHPHARVSVIFQLFCIILYCKINHQQHKG